MTPIRAGRAAFVVLLAVPAHASAVSGGGTSPIGAPEVLVEVHGTQGPYDFLGPNPSIEPAMTESSDYIQVTQIFEDPSQVSPTPDRGDAYADAAGVFWAYASRVGGAGHVVDYPVRAGVHSSAAWSQSFVKDRDDAWMTFHVSSAWLRLAPGAFCCSGGDYGARAVLDFSGLLVSGEDLSAGPRWRVREIAMLQARGFPAAFDPLEEDGPIGYTWTEGVHVQTLEFAPYTGAVDLSGIHRGETFTVTFDVLTWAESAVAEGGSVVQAFFRDPLASGGGVVVETDGLTPLDRGTPAPGPSDRAHAVAIAGDEITAAGLAWSGASYDFALAGYDAADGALLGGFGSGGKVTTDFSGGTDVANAIAIQSDGKRVVVGSTRGGAGTDMAVARYDATGAPDPTFGPSGDGRVTLDLGGSDDVARAVAIQPDGRIVIAGSTWNGLDSDLALVRLDAGGALDPTFGAGSGRVTLDIAGRSDFAEAMVLQPDGAIVVAGSTDAGPATRSDFALVRFLPGGELDPGFGSAGLVLEDFSGSGDFAEAVALEPGGSIVVAGHADVGGQADFAVARYVASGALDAGFGVGGRALVDFSGRDHAHAVAVQADGKIVVAGDTSAGARGDLALARLDRSGNADPTFGVGGMVTVDFEGGEDRALALALQPDGYILAAGFAVTATGDDFALLRLVP